MRKTYHVFGGGTFSHVRNHLAIAAPAFGETSRRIAALLEAEGEQVELHLTKMADHRSTLVTNADVAARLEAILADPAPSVIILNTALCDFDAEVAGEDVASGKHAERLHSRDADGAALILRTADKLVDRVRKVRKDVFSVAFKTTTGATPDEQYRAALHLVKGASVNLVLANDTVTRLNMVVAPEESRYHETTDRDAALRGLVAMVRSRSGNRFTRSTVVAGPRVAWHSKDVPANLRAVVEHCIERGAYKPFRGVTAGHFAVKVGEGRFLTSARKENFNHLREKGLVNVVTQGDDDVIAVGAKPSVGGQSQRIVFADHAHNRLECIVHFHCPLKEGAAINLVQQEPYECGSHECGRNTSQGLREVADGVWAVMLDDHGPNIVFRKDVPARRVIDIIEANFDLDAKTGGSVAEHDVQVAA